MGTMPFFLLLAIFFGHPLVLQAQPMPPTSSRIHVVGAVYCDMCLNNGFSRYSYFISGADVHVQCKFSAKVPKTAEMISFSVNRTTDIYGVYKLEIPSIDGIDCVDGPPIQSFCQASLLESSSSVCNVPALKTTTTEVSVKSRQDNLCVYSFTPLSFRPSKKNDTLCRKRAEAKESSNSAASSKSLLPYDFPLPNQQTTSIPQAANLQPLPFPFLSPPPSLPFPFPHLPTYPSNPPFFHSPPPPSFNLGDPTTWIPHIPPPPPPPVFDLRDPKTWTPLLPPFSPPNLQKQNP